MHMIQHMLLLDIVPILAIVALTKVILRPLTRSVVDARAPRRAARPPRLRGDRSTSAVIWAWHIPAAYDEAARHEGIHALEHFSFLLAAVAVLVAPAVPDPRPHAPRRASDRWPTWAPRSCSWERSECSSPSRPATLYPFYADQPRVWGISAGEDQAIAGLIMAVEQSLVMGIALVVLFFRALAESERAEQRRERLEPVEDGLAPGPPGETPARPRPAARTGPPGP